MLKLISKNNKDKSLKRPNLVRTKNSLKPLFRQSL